ncbi:MAG: cation-translocating P-type ATPase [bacterium]
MADLCHLREEQKEELQKQIQAWAYKGFRLIGVAKATFARQKLPRDQHDFSFEFLGLLGFTDPIRPIVAESLKKTYEAGIRVIMITGDYPGTAQYVAKQIGLINSEVYITGTEIDTMSSNELRERIKTVNIFARVMPEQKLAIVNALKTNKEIVAMTGDGVNDAPSLKAAHVGIAMGEKGTDVAREAAGLILLDDDFSSIIQAIELGRRIYDNLKKAISYILAVHIPIAGIALLPVLFNLPIVLLPIHIAFLELIIDPACTIVFEAEPAEDEIMHRPPRNLDKPLFDTKLFALSFFQGVSVLAIVFAVFLYVLHIGSGELEARTLTFVILVVSNVFLIVTNLSSSRSLLNVLKNGTWSLWLTICGVFVAMMSILYVPLLQNLFHFAVMHPDDLFLTGCAALLGIGWFELFKLVHKTCSIQ